MRCRSATRTACALRAHSVTVGSGGIRQCRDVHGDFLVEIFAISEAFSNILRFITTPRLSQASSARRIWCDQVLLCGHFL